MKNLALYIHYPFCKSKCPYCDFNSHINDQASNAESGLISSFSKAYYQELQFFGEILGKRKITSIFFGGGTPSLMPGQMIAGILEEISKIWEIAKNCEISLEANPTSLESQKFPELKNCGINRLSLGIQALNNYDLQFLGRKHSAKEAILAIEMAAKNFENFSFDLIYTRPKQSLKSWRDELNQALDFSPKHLSLYQLTIEKGTKFFSQYQKGEFTLPDEERSAELFELSAEIMAKNQFNHYEISNFAKFGFECKHNLSYWRGEEYLGIGAGAHSRLFLTELALENPSFLPDLKLPKSKSLKIPIEKTDKILGKYALAMVCEPENWRKKVQENRCGLQNITEISPQEIAEELILMGLRISEGISEQIFIDQLGCGFAEIFDQQKLEFLLKSGLIFLTKGSEKASETYVERRSAENVVEMVAEVGDETDIPRNCLSSRFRDDKQFLKIPYQKTLLANAIITKLCEAIKPNF